MTIMRWSRIHSPFFSSRLPRYARKKLSTMSTANTPSVMRSAHHTTGLNGESGRSSDGVPARNATWKGVTCTTYSRHTPRMRSQWRRYGCVGEMTMPATE